MLMYMYFHFEDNMFSHNGQEAVARVQCVISDSLLESIWEAMKSGIIDCLVS